MRLFSIYPTECEAPWISVVEQSKVVGQTVMLVTLFKSVNMLPKPYPQFSCGPPHILETTRTRQKIGDMCGPTGDDFFFISNDLP